MSVGTRHGALLIVGAGPRVGIHVAAKFAKEGFERIVLMARNRARLRDDAFVLSSVVSSAKVEIIEVDLAQEQSLSDGLEEVEEVLDNTPIEVVQFNAARTAESEVVAWPAADLRLDLEISVVAFYTIAQWAMPQLSRLSRQDGYRPTLLGTDGWLERDPQPELFSLGVCQAAQSKIITALAKRYDDCGVFCASVPIRSRESDPAAIAEDSWRLYMSGPDGSRPLECLSSNKQSGQTTDWKVPKTPSYRTGVDHSMRSQSDKTATSGRASGSLSDIIIPVDLDLRHV